MDHTSRNHIQVVGASMCVVILDIRMCNMSASHLNTLCINLSILCSYHTISTPPNRPRLPNFIRRFDLSTPPGTGPVLCAANAAATVTNGNTVSTGVFYFKRFFVALWKKNTKNSPSHLGFSFEPSISKKNEESPGMLFFLFCTPKKKACKTSIYIWIYPSPPASHQNEGFLQQKKWSSSWWLSRNPHPGG